MKIAWLIQNLVPYHHARFEAFTKREGFEAHIMQAISKDSFKVLEYNPESASYTLHTLLDGVDHKEVSAEDLKCATKKALKKLQPDCVCVSGWGLAVGQTALIASLELGIPVVLCSDSNEFDEPRVWYKEWIKKIIVSSCSSYFVAGTSAADYIQKLGGSDCIVGYDVVDNAHFAQVIKQRPEGLPEELESTPFFIVCSRFGEKKNLPRLIRAYAHYVKQCAKEQVDGCKMVIAGDGELRTEIEQEIEQTAMSDHVLLLGAVGYDALPWLYQNTQAFVHASTTEQWGLVVNEAMAAGAPLILSRRCGCAADLLHEADNGFGFDPNNEQDITNALLRFSKLTVEQQKAFGEKSRDIIEDWGPERFAESLDQAVRVAMDAPQTRTNFIAHLLLGLLIRRGQIT